MQNQLLEVQTSLYLVLLNTTVNRTDSNWKNYMNKKKKLITYETRYFKQLQTRLYANIIVP